MGCGSSKHFDDVGPGQRLGSEASSNTSSSKSKPLTPEEIEARRETMIKAAEDRANKGVKRGAPQAGKLSKALSALPADGGRKDEALQAGSNKNQAPLVWD